MEMELFIAAVVSLIVFIWSVKWMIEMRNEVRSLNRKLASQQVDSERHHKELVAEIRGIAPESAVEESNNDGRVVALPPIKAK
jgi:cell division protein FtsL